MHHKEIYKIKNGKETSELTGFKFFASGKNPKNGKNKIYTKTWKIPKGISSKKELDKQLTKAKLSFEEEIEKITYGKTIFSDNTMFIDYAESYGDNLKSKIGSYTYYEKWQRCMPIFKEYLSIYKLKELNKQIIRNFYKDISKRTYIKRSIIVKKSIYELIEHNKLKIESIAKDIGINRLTVRLSGKIGQRISSDVMKAICSYFKVDKKKYFDIQEEEILYSKATNDGIRSMLSAILSSAVEDDLIDFNFCSQIPAGTMTGRDVKAKEIYNTEETQEFVKQVYNEQDPRKKIAFLFMIIQGLRTCEITGLEWKDFDFENKCFKVVRNSVYTSTFGTQTKGTKSLSSTRILPLSDTLLESIKEYKVWWEKEKDKFGTMWDNGIDRLLVNTKGKAMSRGTLQQWLRKAELKYGLKHIPPHSLRHTNITQKLINKIDPLTVAGDAGHRDAKLVLSRYGHYLSEEAKKASNQMNDVFFKKVITK